MSTKLFFICNLLHSEFISRYWWRYSYTYYVQENENDCQYFRYLLTRRVIKKCCLMWVNLKIVNLRRKNRIRIFNGIRDSRRTLLFEFSTNHSQQFNILLRSKNDCLLYMEKFLNNDIINIIVEQTNLYATQFVESHPNWK